MPSQLRDAIESRDFQAARRLTVVVPEVSLEEALELTLLAADVESELYEAMARRWLARLVHEKSPRPSELEAAALALARVGEGSMSPTDAAPILEKVVNPGERDER